MWDASKEQVTVTLGLLEDVLLSSAMLASLIPLTIIFYLMLKMLAGISGSAQ